MLHPKSLPPPRTPEARLLSPKARTDKGRADDSATAGSATDAGGASPDASPTSERFGPTELERSVGGASSAERLLAGPSRLERSLGLMPRPASVPTPGDGAPGAATRAASAPPLFVPPSAVRGPGDLVAFLPPSPARQPSDPSSPPPAPSAAPGADDPSAFSPTGDASLPDEVATETTSEGSTSDESTGGDEAVVVDPLEAESWIPDLGARGDEERQAILDDIDTLANGTPAERLSAAFSLAGKVDQGELRTVARELGIEDDALARLVTNTDVFSDAATLSDPDASLPDRFGAVIGLADAFASLPDGRLADALEPFTKTVPLLESAASFVDTVLLDGEASALDKIAATVDLADELRKANLPLDARTKAILGKFDNAASAIEAALVIADPDSTPGERLKASVDLFYALGGVADDIRGVRKILEKFVDTAELDKAVRALSAADRLPKSVVDALDPEVLGRLTRADIDDLDKLVGSALKNGVELDELGELLGKLGIDDLRRVTEFANKLGDDSLELFVKALGKADGRALSTFVDALSKIDPRLLETVIGAVDDVFGAVAKVLDKAGVKVTKEVGEALLKSLGKIVPLLGAGVAAHDAFRLGEKALDQSLPDDLRYLALTGSKINGVDVAYSVLEVIVGPLTGGAGVAPDIALAVASLSVELILAHEEGRMEALGDAYETPEWIGHANVVTAVVTQDIGGFLATYGPADALEQFRDTLDAGGELAEDAARGLARAALDGAEGARDLLVALLEDASGRVGDILLDAIERLPAEAIENLLGDISDLGERGRELLGNALGEVGEFANDRLDDLRGGAEWIGDRWPL